MNTLWQTKQIQQVGASVLYAAAMWLGGCHKESGQAPDSPQLTQKVTMRDITFYSKALQRGMPYRLVMPSADSSGRKLNTVYLLHGGGGGFRDWTNYSARHFRYEFHTTPGDHNWKQWDEWLPKLFQSLEEHLSATGKI